MMMVGLTGNVASGKTTVANRWRGAGVEVIDADRLGHEVLREDVAVHSALVDAFGEEILDADRSIDRDALGRLAFRSDADTKRLNTIVHPPLLERLSQAIDAAARTEASLVVIDAALIFEFGMDARLDRVVLVTAPVDLRTGRLRERGLDDARIARVMASQMPDGEKVARSEYVIVNDGPIELLHAKADAVLAHLLRVCADAECQGGAR